MTQTWDCAEARPSLGVYVLGAIDPAERGLVDAHLATCRDCRDELAGLAGLPALLARVNPDEISRICADDTVRPMASDEPPRGTARHRARPGRSPAAPEPVAVPVGRRGRGGDRRRAVRRPELGHLHDHHQDATSVSAGPGYLGDRDRDRPSHRGDQPRSPTPRSCGATRSRSLVDHIPIGTTCQLWVVHPDGTETEVAAWTTARDEGKVWYAGSMASTAGPISKFQITAGNKVLLTVTPT